MIISFLQEKGGVGKTTMAVNVAHALKQLGFVVVLVDSDPQGSARYWHTINKGKVIPMIGLDRPTIDKDVKRFVNDCDFVIIDGAPHLSIMSSKTIICSDVVFIPVQPSPYDVWASKSLVDLVKKRQDVTDGKLKSAFVISRRIVNTNLGNEVASVLEDYGLPVLKNGTFQRVAYAECAGDGETVLMDNLKYRSAGNDIRKLTNEILEFSNGAT